MGSYHYYYDLNFTGEETEVLQCSETCPSRIANKFEARFKWDLFSEFRRSSVYYSVLWLEPFCSGIKSIWRTGLLEQRFIHSFNKCLFVVYYVSGTILGNGDTSANETISLFLQSLHKFQDLDVYTIFMVPKILWWKSILPPLCNSKQQQKQ